MTLHSYLCPLPNELSFIFKDRGSKFIAFLAPCANAKEAQMHLNQWRQAHAQAGHLCYAWRLGLNAHFEEKANDDGEPSHSAGTPILNQMKSAGIQQCVLGVVRYFGGTKLGVSGLIHAYKTAAEGIINNCEIEEVELLQHFTLKFNYEHTGMAMRLIEQFQGKIEHQRFDATQSTLHFSVSLKHQNSIKQQLNELYLIEWNEQ